MDKILTLQLFNDYIINPFIYNHFIMNANIIFAYLFNFI